MSRVFNWPSNVRLPGYFRISPTLKQQGYLIDSGYISNRRPEEYIIPTFTQKAWDLEHELEYLGKWPLGQAGYDRTVMSKLSARSQKRPHESIFSNAPSQANITSATNQALPLVVNPCAALQMNPGRSGSVQLTRPSTLPFNSQVTSRADPGQFIQPSPSPSHLSGFKPPPSEAFQIFPLREVQQPLNALISREQDNPAEMNKSLQNKIKELKEERDWYRNKVEQQEEQIWLYQDDYRRRGLSLPSGLLSLANEATRNRVPESRPAISERNTGNSLVRSWQGRYRRSDNINDDSDVSEAIPYTANNLRGDSTTENRPGDFHMRPDRQVQRPDWQTILGTPNLPDHRRL
jgi:hypothetical protein